MLRGRETRGGGDDVEVAFVQFEEWLDEGDAQAVGGATDAQWEGAGADGTARLASEGKGRGSSSALVDGVRRCGRLSDGMDAADAVDAFEQLDELLQERELQAGLAWSVPGGGVQEATVHQGSNSGMAQLGQGTWDAAAEGASNEQSGRMHSDGSGLAQTEGWRLPGFDAAEDVCAYEQLENWLSDREQRPGTAAAMDPATWYSFFRDEGRSFVPEKKFLGRRCGMVFKTGNLGTGYYVDEGLARVGGGSAGRRGIPLCLARLVGVGEAVAGEAVAQGTGSGGGRRRRRRRARRAAPCAGDESVGQRLACGQGRVFEARVGQGRSGVSSGEDDEEWPTGGAIEEASSGGSRSNASDGGEEAGDDDVSETTVEESSVEADDSEKWAQVVGEEDRQETAGGRRQWWLFDSVNPNAWGAGELGGGG